MTKENSIMITEAQADELLKVGVKAEVSYYIPATLAQTVADILKPGKLEGKGKSRRKQKSPVKEFTLSEKARKILSGKKCRNESVTSHVGRNLLDRLEEGRVYARSYIQNIADENPEAAR